MAQAKTTPPKLSIMKYRVHLILILITGTIWEPIYNLLCFLGLNKLNLYPKPEGVPSTENSAIVNLLLGFSIIGAPFALYRKYNLLRNYIEAMDPHLEPLPVKAGEEEEKIQRLNCLEPKKLVGFAITVFLLFLLCGAIIGLGFYFVFTTNNDAFIVMLLFGFILFGYWFAFSMRFFKEEGKWQKAYNAVAEELMKKYNVQ